jgi:hypothetical protein
VKSLLLTSAALLLSCLMASSSRANPWAVYPPIAPDACGPGWYNTVPQGMTYGPNHYLTPSWDPFNGLVPRYGQPGTPSVGGSPGIPAMPTVPGRFAPNGAYIIGAPPSNGAGPGLPGSPLFPSHPYVRSPRDFFMYEW